MSPDNAESLLIDLITDQIVDDERLIEDLGTGRVSLQDLEQWLDQRRVSSQSFIEECGRLIGAMRSKGFGRVMRRGGSRPSAGRVSASGRSRAGTGRGSSRAPA
jgi:hypothetical protein